MQLFLKLLVFVSVIMAGAAHADQQSFASSSVLSANECPDGHCCNAEGDCPTGLCCDDELNHSERDCDCDHKDCGDDPIDIPR